MHRYWATLFQCQSSTGSVLNASTNNKNSEGPNPSCFFCSYSCWHRTPPSVYTTTAVTCIPIYCYIDVTTIIMIACDSCPNSTGTMDLGHSLHDVTVARWLLSAAAPPLFPVSYSHMLQNQQLWRALPQYLPEETLCTHCHNCSCTPHSVSHSPCTWNAIWDLHQPTNCRTCSVAAVISRCGTAGTVNICKVKALRSSLRVTIVSLNT